MNHCTILCGYKFDIPEDICLHKTYLNSTDNMKKSFHMTMVLIFSVLVNLFHCSIFKILKKSFCSHPPKKSWVTLH
jgi:predicted nucleic acid-binding Zn ribbon protein